MKHRIHVPLLRLTSDEKGNRTHGEKVSAHFIVNPDSLAGEGNLLVIQLAQEEIDGSSCVLGDTVANKLIAHDEPNHRLFVYRITGRFIGVRPSYEIFFGLLDGLSIGIEA